MSLLRHATREGNAAVQKLFGAVPMQDELVRPLMRGLLLLLALSWATTALASEPPTPPAGGKHSDTNPLGCYKLPRRDPGSNLPWQVFLGNAAHRLIAYMYGVNHPRSVAFYNNETIGDILEDRGLGDVSLLLQGEVNLCPDISDTTLRHVFEIKPWNDEGLRNGRRQVKLYLAALNRAMLSRRRFSEGTGFQGQILTRFAEGQYIWRLEWLTTEPGVVQYRWTRSRERFESEVEAYQDGQWVELTEQELKQYGGWVSQAVDGMVNRRERLASFSGVVGVVIEFVGNVAVGAFSGVIFGGMGSHAGGQQTPVRPLSGAGGKVIPFPRQPPAAAPPRSLPDASGM